MTDGRTKGAAPAPERFTVTAADGTALPLDAYRPDKRPVARLILFDYRHDNAYVAKVLADLADHLAARGLI